jgi:hypothetical protein
VSDDQDRLGWDRASSGDPRIEAIRARIPAAWGKFIDAPPGWWDLIAELDAQLRALEPDYGVHQVKEKSGGLRYYVDLEGIAPEIARVMQSLITAAETASFATCVVCGKPGEAVVRDPTQLPEVKTLCREHRAEGTWVPAADLDWDKQPGEG